MPVSNKPPAKLQEATPTPPLENEYEILQPASGQQSLLPDEGPREPTRQAAPTDKLWLSIYLPALPLEVLQHADEAVAVFEDRQGIRKVLLANASAMALGLGPGFSVNAALALIPTLKLAERDPQREAQVLKELACWAEKFTSFVCIAAPSLLLLEIAGSLKLFAGLKALRQHIDTDLKRQGFTAAIAIAPTPLAATWFAKANARVCIRDIANLPGKLRSLSLACLDWPDSILKSLRGMGISCIGECLRLPRQGFAKRFGACRLLELDRALGKLPDPRTNYRAPEQFSAHYDFNEEQSDSELLLNACEALLVKLKRFLLMRQIAVQHIHFSLFHLQHPATHLSLGCVQADRAARHWLQLLQLKLERVELVAPVIAIQLRGGQSQSFVAAPGVLSFNSPVERSNAPVTHLAERLRARIGAASVHGVMTVAEHRPQYAWQRSDPCIPHCAAIPVCPADQPDEFAQEVERNDSLMLHRPLWVLAEPRPLSVAEGMPVCEGVLKLLDGPERLETGWWDENGIARDYFIARNPQGVYLWVYRDRSNSGGWYLEGMFG